MIRTLLALVLSLAVAGCPRSEEKTEKDESSSSKKKKSKDKDKDEEADELTDEEICRRILKLAKKQKPDMSEEKAESKVKKCAAKIKEAPALRRKCSVTCLADNDTMESFEKCDRSCRKGDKEEE